MLVLGIETSCDETAVALYDGEKGLVANRVFSQIELHRRHGGVVPELASRDHIERLLPMVEAAIAEAGIALQAIDGIAYTAGPGLIGALLVGACLARALGYARGLPVIGVHHLEGVAVQVHRMEHGRPVVEHQPHPLSVSHLQWSAPVHRVSVDGPAVGGHVPVQDQPVSPVRGDRA